MRPPAADTTPPPEEPPMLLTAASGYLGAVQRYRTAQGTAGRDAAARLLVPLTEALWWARALDEYLDTQGADREAYREKRRTHRLGQVMIGVRYARNRAGHQLARVLDYREGVTIPVRLPFRMGDYKWRPLSQLPPPPPDKPDHRGKEAYDRLLAIQPVTNTLDDVTAWFREQPELHAAFADVPAEE